ncbi:MAG: YcxB family protein [Cyanobacteriota bacterium]|nr:YcxB family protein [Cyanobacteriota bacterium]
MKIEYRLNLKDYQEANKFHFRDQKNKYRTLWFFSCFWLVVGLSYLIFNTGTLLGLLWIAIAILINPETNLIIHLLLNSSWKNQSEAARELVEMEVLEESLSKEAPSYKIIFRWSFFSKFIETPHLFILCEGKSLMHVIPKRAFQSDEQIQDFKALLDEKISPSN